MWEDQILTYKVARFWFAILSWYSGLFGLYDLGIQTKVHFWWISSKWPQTNEKRIKFWFLIVSGLWFGLHDLHWPFTIFLRSLMPKKSSGMQQSYIRANSFRLRFPISDQCAPRDGAGSVTYCLGHLEFFLSPHVGPLSVLRVKALTTMSSVKVMLSLTSRLLTYHYRYGPEK